MLRNSAYFVTGAGLVLSVAGAVPLISAATPGATLTPVNRPRTAGARGRPAWSGWARSRSGHGRSAIAGTVATAPGPTVPTTFTLNVAGPVGAGTLLTVDASSATTVNEPGASPPSLSGILAGDRAQVVGTPGRAGCNCTGAGGRLSGAEPPLGRRKGAHLAAV